MNANKTMAFFFRAMGVGMVLSALRIDTSKLTLFEIVKSLGIALQYNLINGIWFGLFGLFGLHLYLYLKKKLGQ